MERTAISRGSCTSKKHQEFEVKVCTAAAVKESRVRGEMERARLKARDKSKHLIWGPQFPPSLKWRPC